MPEPKMGFEHQAAQQQSGLGDLLWDAHAAASRILDFTAGRTYEDFASHEVLRAAVASMLQIVIASLEGIQLHCPEHAARIDQAEPTIAFAPKLTSDTELWHFVQDTLPALMAELTAQLEAWHGA